MPSGNLKPISDSISPVVEIDVYAFAMGAITTNGQSKPRIIRKGADITVGIMIFLLGTYQRSH